MVLSDGGGVPVPVEGITIVVFYVLRLSRGTVDASKSSCPHAICVSRGVRQTLITCPFCPEVG